MPLSPAQKTIADSQKRFITACCGRRFGKTTLATRKLCQWASEPNKLIWYVAPTHGMAKQIAWEPLKQKLISLNWVKKINEVDLSIVLVNGSKINLRSADRPDRLRGILADGIVIDEASEIDQKTWSEVLRPTLSTTNGEAFFCFTPKGISSWTYDIFQQAKLDPDNWESFQYTTIDGGQVPEEEIEQAKKDLDNRTFSQEYLSQFITYKGIIYYNYNHDSVYRDKVPETKELIMGLDFNIDPMSCCIGQKYKDGILIFDEIVMFSSNTDEMVQEIQNRYPDHKITVFPDPASRQRKTSAGGRTDLSILVNAGFNVKAKPAHPRIRDRINAVNSALQSADGTRKLWITPNCKNVINSLSRMTYKEGTSVPDESDGLDHMADALGYMVEMLLPITRNRINNNTQPATWTIRTV
tara:strand:+ start:1360 stop:2595 length:1236 start_codon:yes stop_codon:yes gene_type:complete